MESLSLDKRYACNPLWAQLNDLQGALGTPARIAQTVIVAEPAKAKLIGSVLNFLSYFLRSGLVDRREESRCPAQEDVHEAIAILERAERKKTSSETSALRRTKCESLEEPRKRAELEPADDDCLDKVLEKSSAKKLKRSGVPQGGLAEERTQPSEAKLIEEEEGGPLPQVGIKEADVLRGIPLKKKPAAKDLVDDLLVEQKLTALRRQKLTFDNFHSTSKTL
jgi:hypothetical protein